MLASGIRILVATGTRATFGRFASRTEENSTLTGGKNTCGAFGADVHCVVLRLASGAIFISMTSKQCDGSRLVLTQLLQLRRVLINRWNYTELRNWLNDSKWHRLEGYDFHC